MVKVKICGLTDPDLVRFAARAGADWIGFNFIETSPRYVTEAAAASLLMQVGNAVPVALLANPDKGQLDRVAALGFPVIQLHGDETPETVADVAGQTGVEVWKALGVSTAPDLVALEDYLVADRILMDARPPAGAGYGGGHGAAFDWSILKGWTPPRPWLLAGGLTPENVAAAIAQTGAGAVDVSSGVERIRGVKDRELIRAFIQAAKDI